MANGKQIEAKADDAEKRDRYWAMALDMEHTLIRSRASLTLIARSLEDFAQNDAVQSMSEDDASMLYGAVNLLDYIIRECDEAVMKGAGGEQSRESA